MLHDPSETDLQVTVDAHVVSVGGEIDMDSVELLRAGLIEAARAGHHEVAVDMSAITFIDSTGLRELVDFRQQGHRVTITNPSESVIRLLRLTATGPLFGLD